MSSSTFNLFLLNKNCKSGIWIAVTTLPSTAQGHLGHPEREGGGNKVRDERLSSEAMHLAILTEPLS